MKATDVIAEQERTGSSKYTVPLTVELDKACEKKFYEDLDRSRRKSSNRCLRQERRADMTAAMREANKEIESTMTT
jgi:hypothetical protein